MRLDMCITYKRLRWLMFWGLILALTSQWSGRVDAIESKEERQKEHVGEQQAVASIDLYAFLSRWNENGVMMGANKTMTTVIGALRNGGAVIGAVRRSVVAGWRRRREITHSYTHCGNWCIILIFVLCWCIIIYPVEGNASYTRSLQTLWWTLEQQKHNAQKA